MILNMKSSSINAFYRPSKKARQGIFPDADDVKSLAKKREVIKAWKIDGYQRILKILG